MHYEILPAEQSGDNRTMIHITFEEVEVDFISYAYSEYIAKIIRRGNNGSVSEYDKYMADPYQDDGSGAGRSKVYKAPLPNHQKLIEVLQEFEASTDEVVDNIWHSASPPMYAGFDVRERIDAAKWARKVIQQLGEVTIDSVDERTIEQMFQGFDELLSNSDQND